MSTDIKDNYPETLSEERNLVFPVPSAGSKAVDEDHGVSFASNFII